MPIYEYQCVVCGHCYELLQKVDAQPPRNCPECGKPELSRMVTAAGFRLAGSGWYETDFKTGDKRNLAASPDAQTGDGKGKKKPEKTSAGKPELNAGGKPSDGSKPSASPESD